MKTLIITRHAKSDWGNLSLTDFERQLNERGLRDAPVMGKRLAARNLPLDVIVSSTAKRAEQTASLIANENNIDIAKIMWTKELYHAPPHTIIHQIEAIDDRFDTAMIVCHNPGITHFVNMQCGFVTDNVPTCGMTAFEIDTDNWIHFEVAEKRLLFHDFPKNS
jgi:phosphohistidine phosphatase